MENLSRRTFLKGTLASGIVAAAAGAGLLHPIQAVASRKWSQSTFKAKTVPAALKARYGSASVAQSGKIKIKAPLQAEDGRYVRVSVSSDLPKTESISILVKANVQPMSTSVQLANGASTYFSARVKMAKTSDIYAVVKAGGKLYMKKQNIKVTLGGCGG
jgi:sulfur-oxidizing protein SoxY